MREGLHEFHSSPTTTRVLTLRRKSWAGHVERMGRWELRRPLGFGGQSGQRPRLTSEYDMKMVRKEIR